MLASRVTKRGRTTIPRAVRESLGLQTGDMLVSELRDDRVLLRPALLTFGDPFSTFDAWAGDEDARAYAVL